LSRYLTMSAWQKCGDMKDQFKDANKKRISEVDGINPSISK